MKADYGVDAPNVVAALVVAGIGTCALYFVPGILQPLPKAFPVIGGVLLAAAIVLVVGSKVVKPRFGQAIVDRMGLRGDENVLDLGCGRGLLLIQAAKRLSTGRAFGIDIWDTNSVFGNSERAVVRNAEAEGVADRVQVQTGDVRRTRFDHQYFDHVVSSWVLHNLRDPEDRKAALLEAVRVLKPGGRLVIADIYFGPTYAAFLESLGMENVRTSKPSFLFITPTITVTARKPVRESVEKSLTLS